MNRETWLNALTAELAPLFEEYGKPLPKRLRMTCGFTTSRKAIGQCHYPEGSMDGTTEIFIHPGQADPVDVAQILVHELCHAALGAGFGHGPEFGKIARHFKLEGKLTATYAGESFRLLIQPLLDKIGAYPHATLISGTNGADVPKKQVNKAHINLNCPEDGFHMKVWVGQMSMGRPKCPACGATMMRRVELIAMAAEGEGDDCEAVAA